MLHVADMVKVPSSNFFALAVTMPCEEHTTLSRQVGRSQWKICATRKERRKSTPAQWNAQWNDLWKFSMKFSMKFLIDFSDEVLKIIEL